MATSTPPQTTAPQHPFGELLAQYRARKPGLSQTRLAQLAGYDQAILVRMGQGKKDLTGPSGRDRVMRLIEALADQGALSTLEEANSLLLAASLPPLYQKQPAEAKLMSRLAASSSGHRVRRTNLPATLTSFVGRTQEVADVRHRLGITRLLTLTGTGGVGKTRLAQRVAADVLIGYADGVWFTEFASLRDPGLIADDRIADAIARGLGLIVSERPTQDALTDYLRDRHALLVLDNCEHLIDAVATSVVDLLSACPRLCVLATSREALNVDGEMAWQVPVMNPEQAVQLFEERAFVVRGGFGLSGSADNDAAIALICRQLDGIPLAIELAAACLRSLNLTDIAARLDDKFNLLAGGRRGATPRHQTLRAMLDWSYDLLSPLEQEVLRHLGVCVGGWALEQAQQVAGGDVLPVLTQLVHKSLVVIEELEGETRYRLLETIRDYSIDRLRESNELDRAQRRHAEAYCSLAETTEPKLVGKDQKHWLLRLEREHDNFRAALGWALAIGDPDEIGLRLAAALCGFWDTRGYVREGQDWLNKALAGRPDMPSNSLANAWVSAGHLSHAYQYNELAITDLLRGLKMYEALGNQTGIARTLCHLALVEHERKAGETAQIRAWGEQALALFKMLGDRSGITAALGVLASALQRENDYTQAIAILQERLEICRGLENPVDLAYALLGLGWLKHEQGAYAEAFRLADEGVTLMQEHGHIAGINHVLFLRTAAALKLKDYTSAWEGAQQQIVSNQAIGDVFGEAIALGQIGWIELAQGHTAAARAAFAKSLPMHAEAWAEVDQIRLLMAFGERAVADGDVVRAARLLGFVASQDHLPAEQQTTVTNQFEALSSHMTAAQLELALAEGRAFSLAQAIAYALN